MTSLWNLLPRFLRLGEGPDHPTMGPGWFSFRHGRLRIHIVTGIVSHNLGPGMEAPPEVRLSHWFQCAN